MLTALTIAGSDCSGGAGIQADLKTMAAHGIYGMSVITALTAQNTVGVYGITEVSPEFAALQLKCVFEDIPPDAVKIGMVANGGIIKALVHALKKYSAKNIVIDPVMVSTSGSRLLKEEAAEILINQLLPLGNLITPNISESEILCGFPIKDKTAVKKAAQKIYERFRTAVLIKGGHIGSDAADLLYDGKFQWFESERINNPNTHGTGCTLSSAIACNMAKGYTLSQSIANAKTYLLGAIKDGMDLGKGSGPLNHIYKINI